MTTTVLLAALAANGHAQAAGNAAAAKAAVCVVSDGRTASQRTASAAAVKLLGERAVVITVGASGPQTLSDRCGQVVVAIGRHALQVALTEAAGLPLVFAGVASGERLVTARPRLYGIATHPDPGAVFGTLTQLLPDARRVGVVYSSRASGALIEVARAVATSRSLELIAIAAETTGDAVLAYRRFERELAIDALWILPDPVTTTQETGYQALELAAWRRVPAIGPTTKYVAIGALFAIEPHAEAEGRLAASAALALLEGHAPPRFQYPADTALGLNERIADRLGVRIPKSLRDAADEVVQ